MEIGKCIDTLLRDGFILVFNQDKLDVVKTAGALINAGINNMEVTCRIQQPLEKISRLKQKLPDFAVGAASLIDFPGMLNVYNTSNSGDPLPCIDEVIDSGADYLVSAVNFSDESYSRYAGKVAMIPGCGTATEIVSQYSKGANLCKLFPAKLVGGPGYIKAVDPAIHKTISIVPTGGTSQENISDYIDAGVLVLGGSFSMIEKNVFQKIIDEQDYDLLADELIKVKSLIDECRTAKYPAVDFAGTSVKDVEEATGRNFNLK